MRIVTPLLRTAVGLASRFVPAGSTPSQMAQGAGLSGLGAAAFSSVFKDVVTQGAQGLGMAARDPSVQENILKQRFVPSSVKRKVLSLWHNSYLQGQNVEDENMNVKKYVDVLVHVYVNDPNPEIRQQAFVQFYEIYTNGRLESKADCVDLWFRIFSESRDENIKKKAALVLILYVSGSVSQEDMAAYLDVLPQIVDFVTQSHDPFFCLQFFEMINDAVGLDTLSRAYQATWLALLEQKQAKFEKSQHPVAAGLKQIHTELSAEIAARVEKPVS